MAERDRLAVQPFAVAQAGLAFEDGHPGSLGIAIMATLLGRYLAARLSVFSFLAPMFGVGAAGLLRAVARLPAGQRAAEAEARELRDQTKAAGVTALKFQLPDLLEWVETGAKLTRDGKIPRWPLRETVAAVSVGVCAGQTVLDLGYSEDSEADVDCNIVKTDSGAFVEIQGTAEGAPFSRGDLDRMMDLAAGGGRTSAREFWRFNDGVCCNHDNISGKFLTFALFADIRLHDF